jgi:RimJ/RimL family protein N-acetyltransferase
MTQAALLGRVPAMPTVPTLSDGSVTLRAHSAHDAQGVFEQCQDPISQEWTTVPVPYSLEDAHAFVNETMPRGWADGSSWGFAVELDGQYGGTVELRDEGEGRLEVAYGSHPRVRGTGAMGRAVRLLVDWGFADRSARVIVWRANKGNWPSRKLAWRLGFSFEGTVRAALPHRGELRDGWTGTLLPTDDRAPKDTWFDVPTLEREGLRLRAWRESDVSRIVEACTDPRTRRWLPRLPDPYDETQARSWLEAQTESRATGRSVCWAVVDPADEATALASISLFDNTPEAECEIGYRAHPDARGKGVVTRAMREVVRYCFEDLGVRRVAAAAAVENTASLHVVESSGLRPWGVERLGTEVHGGRSDLRWFDLLIEEWRATRSR